jgi:hypothetical protein
MRFFLGIMVFVLTTVCMPLAAAHLPYFRGYASPVALPGGDSGLLRRLYGDGIMLADPVRPVVIDKRGDVRALGPVGYAAEHSCSGGSCRVYVYNDTSLLPDVYRFDLRSTKSTDVPSAAGGADALDAVMRTEGIYGFVATPDLSARVAGALACLMQWWPSFVILLLIGGSAVPVWVCLGMAIGPHEENRLGSAMRAVLCAGAIALPAFGLYWLFLFLTAYPPLLSLIAICIPTLVWSLHLMVRNKVGGAAVAAA